MDSSTQSVVGPWFSWHAVKPDPSALVGTARRIYRYIARRTRKGATSDEVEQALGIVHQSASARINEMRNAGLIEESGRYRKTRSGRNANVFMVAATA